MSIASEITRLQGVKSDILQAISDKGVMVPAGSALDDCPGLISSISVGGGPTPLPDNWVTVLGVKKVSDYRGNFFRIVLSETLSNENLIFEFDMKFIDIENTSDSILISSYPPDLSFNNNIINNSYDIYCGNDDGTYDINQFPKNSQNIPNLNDRFKIIYNRNSAQLLSTNGSYNLSIYYSIKNFGNFCILTNYREFNSYVFYGLTIKKRDTGEYVLKLIPVKNTVNNDCGFYDMVTGTLYQADHNPDCYQAVE